MILQKLASAIRRQDWFQVVIEVLIVIVGIFLGLQVQTFYESQADRAQEAVYVDQLHNEVVELVAAAEIGNALREDIHRNLLEIVELLKKGESGFTLSNSQCNSIHISHIYTDFVTPSSVINELESTGRTVLIQNSVLRSQLIKYRTTNDKASETMGNIDDDKVVLSSKFPDILEVGYPKSGNVFDIYGENGNVCSETKILENTGFKNDLLSNTNRYTYFTGAVTLKITELNRLHQLIDQELGIEHEEDGV